MRQAPTHHQRLRESPSTTTCCAKTLAPPTSEHEGARGSATAPRGPPHHPSPRGEVIDIFAGVLFTMLLEGRIANCQTHLIDNPERPSGIQ